MLRNRKWIWGVLGALALFVAALTGSTAYAQNTATTSPLAPPTNGASPQVLGRGGVSDKLLADALGITVDELQAAELKARAAAVDQAQADGSMTADDAATMKARFALQEYLAEPMKAAYEAAVAQAVTAGVITQTQADQFLAEGWNSGAARSGPGAIPGGPMGPGGGQGGPGAPGDGGFGGMGPGAPGH